MKTVIPSYARQFRCIAGACRHSCCIGWEIDIDEDTLSRYDDPACPMYSRLQNHIDHADIPHFRLDREERCPFLNREGLCDIILTMGEESLCQICTDHPRFRNLFSDRTEMGLGLCCEAAADLLLSQTEPIDFLTEEDPTDLCEPLPEERDFYALRAQIYAILQKRTVSMGNRIREMLSLCGAVEIPGTVSEWTKEFRQLERLDPAWECVLDALESNEQPLMLPEAATPWELPLENLAVYFIFRHLADALDDDRLAARCLFCALSVSFVHAVLRQSVSSDQPADLTDIVRMYSSEIEYSEDNMETLISILDEISMFPESGNGSI